MVEIDGCRTLMSLSLLAFLRPLLPNLGLSNSATNGDILWGSNFPLLLVWDRNSRFLSFLNYLSGVPSLPVCRIEIEKSAINSVARELSFEPICFACQ